jgi:hypothetical protein
VIEHLPSKHEAEFKLQRWKKQKKKERQTEKEKKTSK